MPTPANISRRSFIKLAAGAGAAAIIGLDYVLSPTGLAAENESTTMPASNPSSMPASNPANAALDLDAIGAIEMHSHINNADGIALIRKERLGHALLMWHGDDALLELARKNKDVVSLLLWVNPTREGYLAAAKAAVSKNADIVRGFKLHPPIDKYTVSHDLLKWIFELANRLNLLIESHTEAESCNAAKFLPLLKTFPKTKLVLLHGFPADETYDIINAYPNVYVDTSSTAWGKVYQSAALKAVGMNRIAMGLDSPIAFPTKDGHLQPHFRKAIGEIAAFYDNDPQVARRVLCDNARELLDSLATPTTAPATGPA